MLVHDEWVVIEEFPRYVVSQRGLVFNDKKNHPLAQCSNQSGHVYVSLFKDGKTHTRSVALLVARAFLPVFRNPEEFDTPIHLDNQPHHNFVENLAWRPFWYAKMFREQFAKVDQNHIPYPIVCHDTGQTFENSLDAAMKDGLLERELIDSIATCRRSNLLGRAYDVL